MSASQDHRWKHLTFPNWLTTELIVCIIAFGHAVGSFAVHAGHPLRASESFVGILFQPSAIAIGKFGEQLYYEPRLLPESLITAQNKSLSDKIASAIDVD
jgi:hypothetical protein